MNFRYPSIAACALISLLLLGQYLSAQHNVEHLSRDAIEICEVCKYFEQDDDVVLASQQLFVGEFNSDIDVFYQDNRALSLTEWSGARGPPLSA